MGMIFLGDNPVVIPVKIPDCRYFKKNVQQSLGKWRKDAIYLPPISNGYSKANFLPLLIVIY